jgi:hypothetical protein|tara:strand:+ start:655 stop:849 length:195 start_codon:yes stop_codon:yes gene_type:complete
MSNIQLLIPFKSYNDIPKELHNEILYGNQVENITDVSLEDINSRYEDITLTKVITDIKQYMGDL